MKGIIDGLRNLSDGLEQIQTNTERIDRLERDGPQSGVVASDHGFPGDGTGGDIAKFICENLGEKIILDGETYSLESEIDIDPGDTRLHLQGGTLRIDSDDIDTVFRVGNWGDGIEECILTDVTIDLNGHDSGVGRFFVDDYLNNTDIRLEGRRNCPEKNGDTYTYLSCITDECGVGYNQIKLPDGDVWAGDNTNSPHSIGLASDPPHKGTQYWINCYVSQFWGNGYYIRNSPDGTNILIAPRAENCGRANIRLGKGDVAYEPISIWDMDPNHEHFPVSEDGESGFGTLLASDGDGAAFYGGKAVSRNGRNDLVRTWGSSGKFTLNGTTIVNETDQWSIRLSGDDKVAKIENVDIREESGAWARGAAVCSRRPNVVLDSVDYSNEGRTDSRAFLEARGGASATVKDSKIESASENVVRLRHSPDKIVFDRCSLNGGLELGSGVSIDVMDLQGCDMRECRDLWTGDGDESNVGTFRFDSFGI